ncbi:hypothetical protein QFZ60_001589 [Arthrobacter sp. B2I5]|uniref:hypothetical protein n=1 Tax=Arthrobacter sp. B2I5 TaxID=3042266 RepID=UPI002785DCDF|nr:hypothetical protein [Arthrobacter sp. B2I5]MDQ0825416.1 hypothetical protein [Arthrobacter sp. B2I5]
MATVQPGERYTALTGADLRGKRYHIVKFDSNCNIVLASAGSDTLIGVLDYEPRTAVDSVDVVLANGAGTFKVKTATNLAAGVLITANANGQAVLATTGQKVIGRTLRASVAGEIAEYYKLDTVA